MQCIVAPSYTDPSRYELGRLPIPNISEPSDVQIEIHAASINPIDVKKASGALKIALKDEYGITSDSLSFGIALTTDVSGFPIKSATTVPASSKPSAAM